MASARVQAVFPQVARRAGMYESFYLRAVSPEEPLGIWIRYTVHKRPGRPPRGSLWCTFFDGARGHPFMHKSTTDALAVPADGWIAVGAAELGRDRAEGSCGEASWSLRIATREGELRHLPRAWMYRAPLPRTKLTSPAPAARFDGTFVLANPSSAAEVPTSAADTPTSAGDIATSAGDTPTSAADTPTSAGGATPRTIELRDWRGMVGHNWGAEHAERWIWLHGIGFEEDGEAWLDVALGRIRVAGRTTPWVANGALSLEGRRYALGGLGARGLLVAEAPGHCGISLRGADGLVVEVHVDSPADAIAGWRYADPDGGGHDVANCSIAALALTVSRPGRPSRTLRTAYGAAYELGMRERDHGVAIAPFPDGE